MTTKTQVHHWQKTAGEGESVCVCVVFSVCHLKSVGMSVCSPVSTVFTSACVCMSKRIF